MFAALRGDPTGSSRQGLALDFAYGKFGRHQSAGDIAQLDEFGTLPLERSDELGKCLDLTQTFCFSVYRMNVKAIVAKLLEIKADYLFLVG